MILHRCLASRKDWIASTVFSWGLLFPLGHAFEAPLWATDETETKFEEGWRRAVPLSEPDRNGNADECVAWVQDGWLQVKRQTADGKAQWQVVLARANDATAPEIEVVGRGGTIQLLVRFREGRYFIRDTPATSPPRPRADIPANLICYREPKPPGGQWPHLSLPEADPKRPGRAISNSGPGSIPCSLVKFNSDSWSVVATGPAIDESDCILRLYDYETVPGRGASVMQRNLPGANVTVGELGDISVVDDGELLVAHYIDEPTARRLLGRPRNGPSKSASRPRNCRAKSGSTPTIL